VLAYVVRGGLRGRAAHQRSIPLSKGIKRKRGQSAYNFALRLAAGKLKRHLLRREEWQPGAAKGRWEW